MRSLDWVLTEHLVRATTWTWMSSGPAAQSATDLLLAALAMALAVAALGMMPSIGTRAIAMCFPSTATAPRPLAARAAGRDRHAAPVGGRGARAPGRLRRRSRAAR